MKKVAIPALVLLAGGCSWPSWTRAVVKEKPFDNKDIILDGVPLSHAGFADLATNTIYIDEDCSGDGVCLDELGDREFWHTHEQAHIAVKFLNFPLGADLINQERSANCIAEVITHHGPNFTDDVNGYWDCPDQEVVKFRRLMLNANMAEQGDM